MENYDIIEEIGKGSFSTVYKIIRKEDKTIYAMKSIRMRKLSQKEKENSLNEIRILASINSNYIISYKDAFYNDESNSLNIVMEYCDDGDLDNKIEKQKKSRFSFLENDIWNIFYQIVLGLKALHDNRIVHRDIKSANIFLTKEGLAKLGDLNVSKEIKLGMLKTQTGTPYYASPEVWKDKPYDFKSDIWSIGCVLYEMCTFNPPFRGNSLQEVYDKVCKGNYQPLTKSYSKELNNMISSLLKVNPLFRPSADAILSNLSLLQHKGVIKLKYFIDNIEEEKFSEDILLKTIKIPYKINEINNILPKSKFRNISSVSPQSSRRIKPEEVLQVENIDELKKARANLFTGNGIRNNKNFRKLNIVNDNTKITQNPIIVKSQPTQQILKPKFKRIETQKKDFVNSKIIKVDEETVNEYKEEHSLERKRIERFNQDNKEIKEITNQVSKVNDHISEIMMKYNIKQKNYDIILSEKHAPEGISNQAKEDIINYHYKKNKSNSNNAICKIDIDNNDFVKDMYDNNIMQTIENSRKDVFSLYNNYSRNINNNNVAAAHTEVQDKLINHFLTKHHNKSNKELPDVKVTPIRIRVDSRNECDSVNKIAYPQLNDNTYLQNQNYSFADSNRRSNELTNKGRDVVYSNYQNEYFMNHANSIMLNNNINNVHSRNNPYRINNLKTNNTNILNKQVYKKNNLITLQNNPIFNTNNNKPVQGSNIKSIYSQIQTKQDKQNIVKNYFSNNITTTGNINTHTQNGNINNVLPVNKLNYLGKYHLKKL